jgi:Leucine-rich repeat (LRR) protein
LDAGDIVFIASAIGSKTLLKLDISNNDLNAEGGTALSAVLDGNQIMTELNIANNRFGFKAGANTLERVYDATGNRHGNGVIAIANSIKNMGALSKLDASNNGMFGKYDETGTTAWASALKACTSITALNLAENGINDNDATILAAAISDMEAISSVNLLKNAIPVKQARELVKIMQSKEKLATLCGLCKEETELDFSSQHLGVGDAVLIANDNSDMEALSKLLFGGVPYHQKVVFQGGGAQWVIPEPATLELGMTEVDLSNKDLKTAGAIIIAAWISHRDKGAMSVLNLASNAIGGTCDPYGNVAATPEGIYRVIYTYIACAFLNPFNIRSCGYR